MTSLRELHDQLEPDPLRDTSPFSSEFGTASEQIAGAATPEEAIATLQAWLAARNQPCLFGRIAAKSDLLSYCILDEADLRNGDEFVQSKIQNARLEWTAQTFRGQKSGFIILLRSRRLATAAPNEILLSLAQSLATYYLLESVVPNEIYLEEAFLEAPGSPPKTWKWDAGVNYFGAQGEGRWWRDHRIPGGIAFSVNSVGHMVKSEVLARAMRALGEQLDLGEAAGRPIPLDALPKALLLAMKTINLAAETPWGRATSLLDPSEERHAIPPCPIELTPDVSGKDHCRYQGWYHTDQTIPAEYFREAPARTTEHSGYSLDFRYLFDSALDNPDYQRMGAGVRIRTDESFTQVRKKGLRMEPDLLEVSSIPRLREALEQFG